MDNIYTGWEKVPEKGVRGLEGRVGEVLNSVTFLVHGRGGCKFYWRQTILDKIDNFR